MKRAVIWPVLLAIWIYTPGLGGGFVYDDEQLLVDSDRLVTATPRLAFTSDFWGLKPEFWRSHHYRPAAMLAYSGLHALFGLSPFAFHGANILLHAAATLALFFLITGAGQSEKIALAATLLFAVHPIHVESVAWMTGLTETLAAAAALGSLACFVHGRWWWSLSLAAIAMLTKETGLIIPPLVWYLAWERRRPARPVIWFWLLAAAYLALRTMVLPRPPQGAFTALLLARWPVIPESAAHYLMKLFAPWPLAIHYELPRGAALIAATLILAAIAALAWRLAEARIAAALLSLPLAIPVATSALMVELLQVQDRYAYLASAGACLLAALLLARLPGRGLWLACLLLLPLAALGTHLQLAVWQDNESLWTHTLRVTPSSKSAALNLGYALYVEQRFLEAERVYRQALRHHPGDQELLKCLKIVQSQR